jgi:Cancer susceptibility candidate 1 N-terminus
MPCQSQSGLLRSTSTTSMRRLEYNRREDMCGFHAQRAAVHAGHDTTRASLDDWARHLSCTVLPHVAVRSAMTEYINAQAGRTYDLVPAALRSMNDDLAVIASINAHLHNATPVCLTDSMQLCEFRGKLFQLIEQHADAATLWFLHHSNFYADAEGNVKHEVMHQQWRWGTWLNVHKNPRMKCISFAQIGVQIDVPKQLALAPVAVRAQINDTAEAFWADCSNEMMAVGPLIRIDLLVLPPTSKNTVNDWVLRVHGPLTHHLHHLPYPLTPGGMDSSGKHGDDDVPPLHITVNVKPTVLLMDKTAVQVSTSSTCS